MHSERLIRLGKFAQRLNIVPFVIALLVLGFILLTAVELVVYPDDGIINLQRSGLIVSLDPNGPTIGKLQEGDIILSIEGAPFAGMENPAYFDIGKRGGDSVEFLVLRDGEETRLVVQLAHPSQSLIVNRLVAILVAMIFWGVGLVVQAFKPIGKGSDVTFAWFQTSALTLSAGAASTMGSSWASSLFNGLVWFLGPLSVHFHTQFPQPISRKGLKTLLAALYGIAFLGIVPYIILGFVRLGSLSWYPSFLSANRLFLSLNLILVVGLLYYSYLTAAEPGARSKVRLVFLGGVLVAMLFVTLTILPEALVGQTIISYSIAFLLLGLLPLTYGFAIFRLHLIEIDQKINRGATYLLVYSILGFVYIVLYAIFSNLLPVGIRTTALINTLLILVLATVLVPIRVRVQRMVDRVFYGSWYDYRVGIKLITDNLGQITDLRLLARTLSERLVKILRLVEAVVFLRDQSGDFSVVEVAFGAQPREGEERNYPVLPRSSLTYLLKIGVSERTELLRSLSQITVTPEELRLLKTEQIHLWVPVIGHGQILGLVALGPKLGGDVFSADDMDILRVVVQQVGPVIENLHLLADLKDYASELEKRVDERTAELYDEKERIETILASVGDGVIFTNLKGHIQTVNRAFERLSGLSAEQVKGQNLFEILAEENESSKIAVMRETLARDEIWSGELVGRRVDGSQYNVQFTIAPVHGRQGETIGYVGSQSDITRQKELDRMKDTFISDVSHELRTPITSISLYLELLKSAPLERQKRYLDVVKDQSDVLTKLVEDILDLSRLTASKTRPLTFSDVDLNSLVEQVVTAHMAMAESAGLELIFELDPGLPLLRAEQNQIARLITNLLTNAIRYTPEGEVRVKTVYNHDKIGLIVQDTGIGIEAEDIPHLFERFFRGRNVRQSDIHGTGLGLSIVKEIVDFHGGEIEIESQIGKGTTFKVWLPNSWDA